LQERAVGDEATTFWKLKDQGIVDPAIRLRRCWQDAGCRAPGRGCEQNIADAGHAHGAEEQEQLRPVKAS
jgi:hypothetical protein